jgi:hypothetical protein
MGKEDTSQAMAEAARERTRLRSLNFLKSYDANNAAAVRWSAWFADSHGLCRKVIEVLSRFKLHAVDLSQKPGSCGTVIHGVGLSPTEMG